MVNTRAVNLQRRSRKRFACTPGNAEIIDIDALPPTPDDEPKGKNAKWIQTPQYTLTRLDQEYLMNPAAWLNDRIVQAAQALLQQQFQIPGSVVWV